MNRKDLYKGFNEIDDDILERSETASKSNRQSVWRRWAAVAACFCVLLVAVTVVPHLLPETTPDEPDNNDFPIQSEGNNQTEGPWIAWQPTFNSATGMLDAAKTYIPGYFTEELSEEELAAIEPGMRIGFMQYSGYAGFDGNGELVDVFLTITTTIPENVVSVCFGKDNVFCGYVTDGEPVTSVSRWDSDVVFTAYQWDSGDNNTTLAAEATINGYVFSFTLTTSQANLTQAKEDFSQVLECFSCYPDDGPYLSLVTPDAIPDWCDETLSHADALNDPDYGAYMIQSVPSGYTAESIRRYKDQSDDYLSGLWTSGYDEIRWSVSTFSEADASRLTSVADTENYDLSLYPIPRASSVPEELWEIVDNPIFYADELTVEAVWARAYKTGETGDSSGWRMAFSVRYGNIVVEVRTKGVDPEWVYQQLISLTER